MVLVGGTHVSVPMFAQTIADAYHTTISLHFDSMSGGGKIVNNTPKFPILYQQILQQCNANMATHSQIQLIQQIGPMIMNYWAGISIIGPLGNVTVLSPGSFVGLPVIQNNNFNIMLDAMIMSFRTHLLTITGVYVSSVVPGVTAPWGGSLMQCLP